MIYKRYVFTSKEVHRTCITKTSWLMRSSELWLPILRNTGNPGHPCLNIWFLALIYTVHMAFIFSFSLSWLCRVLS
jgi:hypothetical protein